MATTDRPTPTRVDWAAIAREFQRHQATLIHDETGWHGDEFYAEALRRTFGYSTNDGADGGRELPYDTINDRFGLTTRASADHTRDSHTIFDRLNREDAQRQAREAREEARNTIRNSAQIIADHIREWCNERRITSRYRREGFLAAADLIDPRVPKDRFGNPLPRPEPE
jgi:hypothetical protein